MNKPNKIKIDDKIYNINTDFRIALQCNAIAQDTSISDYERALAIVYLLLGDKGLECENLQKAIELCVKYISFGNNEKGLNEQSRSKADLDFTKCEGLIRSSFKFDYNYDPYELEYLHWYDYYNDLENLSTSEFGTCCPLNRVIGILNQDTSKIKDSNDRKTVINAQKLLKQKYCKEKDVKLSKEQEDSAKAFFAQIKLE